MAACVLIDSLDAAFHGAITEELRQRQILSIELNKYALSGKEDSVPKKKPAKDKKAPYGRKKDGSPKKKPGRRKDK